MEAFLEHQPIYSFSNLDVPFTIQGYSRAARLTGFWLPELGILLDAGVRTDVIPKAVLITHTHTDHAGELGQIAMNKQTSFPIYCHPRAVEPLRNYLCATANLRGCSTQITWNPVLFAVTLQSLHPSDGYVAFPTIANWYVRGVFLQHSVPNLAYVIAQQINGVMTPWLAYLCDGTTSSIVKAMESMEDRLPVVVMVECTYLDDQELAQSRKHVNWPQLNVVIQKYSQVQFLLFHFSTRLTPFALRRWSQSLPPNVKVAI